MSECRPAYITEAEVDKLLTWPAVFEVCVQALQSVCEEKTSDSQPSSIQPARPFANMKRRNGLAFSMLGYIDNYRIKSIDADKAIDSLGHKLLTAFPNNVSLPKPLPVIIATIFMLDTETGRMKTIIEANGITGWRTAGLSMASTKYLYFDRNEQHKGDKVLAILGCGIQGRIHAIGFGTMFGISEIHLWNRSVSRASNLKKELDTLTASFKNKNLKIFVHESVHDCVKTADIIVTATQSTTPVLFGNMLKENVHINAVGASFVNHHSELDATVYESSKLYVDSYTGAKTELKALNCPVEAEVGEIINKSKVLTKHPRTIYHALGMAVSDVAVAQIAETLYHKNK
ncbi:ketimine reductase mu-crystallin-like [Bradysia coprophila]|uniref:ketimine reductase mu-crystallin-like n=1 Tax=Bradysia coprophila TaxID=38358 RepID=UPI00187DCE0E|nr:ketimine reductase mu-crystallin-like [Bradysia coprophila]